jgi:hypothetical protein
VRFAFTGELSKLMVAVAPEQLADVDRAAIAEKVAPGPRTRIVEPANCPPGARVRRETSLAPGVACRTRRLWLKVGPLAERRLSRSWPWVVLVLAVLAMQVLRRGAEASAPSTARVPESSAPTPGEPLPIVRPGKESVLPLIAEVNAGAKLDRSKDFASSGVIERRFAVQVVDEDSHAVADAWVSVGPLGAEEQWLAANIDRLRELSRQPDGPEKSELIRAFSAEREAETQSAPTEPPSVYRSDADGWCRFSASRDVVVQAEKDGVGTSGEWCSAPPPSLRPRKSAATTTEPGAEQQVRLQLHPQATIAGQVLDRQGEPLPECACEGRGE